MRITRFLCYFLDKNKKNKKSKDIPTYKMSETFKIADVEYTIHTKEVV